MAFHPSTADRADIEAFLGIMLDAYKQGRAEKDVIVGILAGVITSAAHDNRTQFDAEIRKSESQHFAD